MQSLGEVLARLDRFTNHEVVTSAGVSAGKVEGLSLTAMEHLCALLGDPQDTVRSIHVTGTNGKGSVSAIASELMVANGLNVGLYSSPHLRSINERLRRNGEPIGDDDLAEVLDGVLSVAPLLEHPPTWFELVTAAAFRWFSEAGIDVAVVEVGLLGRWDATNVVTSDVAVITNIGADHTDFSDGWRRKVAEEKAGIVVPGRDVVCGELASELVAVVEAEGASRTLVEGRDFEVTSNLLAQGGRMVSFTTPWGRHDDLVIAAHGEHQGDNLAIATCAVEAFFDRELDDEVVRTAAASVRLPGRIEVVSHHPLVVLDGAHNAEAAERLSDTLDEEFATIGSRIAIVGMLEGRDPAAVLEPIARARFDLIVCTRPDSPRGAPASKIAAAAAGLDLTAEIIDDPTEAVTRVVQAAQEEDLILVAGSFYLIGPARELLLGRNAVW